MAPIDHPPLSARRSSVAAASSPLCWDCSSRLPTVGRSAVLIGEPGMGKTRLTEELAERAVERGFRVHLGRCSSDEGAPPLWPWTMLLRSLSDDRDVTESTDPVGLLEPRASPSDTAATNASAAHGSDRFAQFDEVARALAEAAARQPRMLILDDLHWADPSTLRLLRHVTETVDRGRLAIVVTRRAHPVPSGALADYSETLARRHALRLELAGLTVDDIGELVTATDAPAMDAGVGAALRERTGGNPFFLLELLRANRSGVGINAVPASVSDVIMARMGRLPAATQAVLRSAATLGRTVDPDLLARLTGGSVDDAFDALEPAVDAGLLTVTVDGELRFAHGLVRDAVEATDSPLRRQRRHAAAARALGESDNGSGRHLAEQAWHWLRAGPAHAAQAWRAAGAAAADATGLAAHEEAADLLAAALAAQSSDPAAGPIERYDLLMARAAACRAAADNGSQRAATSEAIEIADRLGDLERPHGCRDRGGRGRIVVERAGGHAGCCHRAGIADGSTGPPRRGHRTALPGLPRAVPGAVLVLDPDRHRRSPSGRAGGPRGARVCDGPSTGRPPAAGLRLPHPFPGVVPSGDAEPPGRVGSRRRLPARGRQATRKAKRWVCSGAWCSPAKRAGSPSGASLSVRPRSTSSGMGCACCR